LNFSSLFLFWGGLNLYDSEAQPQNLLSGRRLHERRILSALGRRQSRKSIALFHKQPRQFTDTREMVIVVFGLKQYHINQPHGDV